jgi:hypothetical protein
VLMMLSVENREHATLIGSIATQRLGPSLFITSGGFELVFIYPDARKIVIAPINFSRSLC